MDAHERFLGAVIPKYRPEYAVAHACLAPDTFRLVEYDAASLPDRKRINWAYTRARWIVAGAANNDREPVFHPSGRLHADT